MKHFRGICKKMTTVVIGTSFLTLLIAVSHSSIKNIPFHIQSYMDIWAASCEERERVLKMYFYSFPHFMPQIAQKIAACMTQPSYPRCHIPHSLQLHHTLYIDLAPNQKCRFSVVPHGKGKNWQILTVSLPTRERGFNHCG